MGCLSLGPVLAGVDSVAFSFGATDLSFGPKGFRKNKVGIRFRKFVRGDVSLFVCDVWGSWQVRVQVSLPRMLWGHNFEPVPLADLESALGEIEYLIPIAFPEISRIPLLETNLTRVDFPFDFPISTTPELIFALRDCYLGGRDKPGFVYEGPRHCSFYSKDSRDKAGKIQYRSLIAYPKFDLDDGTKGLRVESRLHAEAISYSLGRKIALGQLPSCASELQRHAWRQVDQRFEFLRPVGDEFWERQTSRIRSIDGREMMETVGFFFRGVPLDSVAKEPFADRKAIRTYMRRYKLGYGDPDRNELCAFAMMRDDLSDYFSIPY